MSDEDRTYQKAKTGKPLALEARDTVSDGRLFSPSIARNQDIVREVYSSHMPIAGTILEIASGTGEHGANIAHALQGLTWIYSDIDADSLASQAAWRAHKADSAALRGPIELDVTITDWAAAGAPTKADGMFCANMIHIAPFSAAQGLLTGAGRHLISGGRLMLYGPFARNGEIAPSNAQFSNDLKRRDTSWGVRDLDRDLVPLAKAAGLTLTEVVEMPANNLSVIWTRD
ncbi:MAG: DUF938 domain-containing protein [Pseudomonadota bacterium]